MVSELNLAGSGVCGLGALNGLEVGVFILEITDGRGL